jgi:hypothetical protein
MLLTEVTWRRGFYFYNLLLIKSTYNSNLRCVFSVVMQALTNSDFMAEQKCGEDSHVASAIFASVGKYSLTTPSNKILESLYWICVVFCILSLAVFKNYIYVSLLKLRIRRNSHTLCLLNNRDSLHHKMQLLS